MFVCIFTFWGRVLFYERKHVIETFYKSVFYVQTNTWRVTSYKPRRRDAMTESSANIRIFFWWATCDTCLFVIRMKRGEGSQPWGKRVRDDVGASQNVRHWADDSLIIRKLFVNWVISAVTIFILKTRLQISVFVDSRGNSGQIRPPDPAGLSSRLQSDDWMLRICHHAHKKQSNIAWFPQETLAMFSLILAFSISAISWLCIFCDPNTHTVLQTWPTKIDSCFYLETWKHRECNNHLKINTVLATWLMVSLITSSPMFPDGLGWRRENQMDLQRASVWNKFKTR